MPPKPTDEDPRPPSDDERAAHTPPSGDEHYDFVLLTPAEQDDIIRARLHQLEVDLFNAEAAYAENRAVVGPEGFMDEVLDSNRRDAENLRRRCRVLRDVARSISVPRNPDEPYVDRKA